jgi:hypothetical protein
VITSYLLIKQFSNPKANQGRQNSQTSFEDDGGGEEKPTKTRNTSMSTDDFDLIYPQPTVNDSTLVIKGESSQSMKKILDEEGRQNQDIAHRMSSTTTVNQSMDIGHVICDSCLCHLPPLPQQPEASKQCPS